ncbi:hypothetical protein JCM9279_005162 [Rhodotorula babjevae]
MAQTMLTSAALAAWAAAALSLASPVSSPSSSSADPVALILVLSRDGRPASSVPNCATYHGMVGAQHLSDIYYVSTACAGSVVRDKSSRPRRATPGELVMETTDMFSHPTPGDSLSGALVWLHPTRRDLDRPTSSAVEPVGAAQQQQQQQLAFSAPSSPHSHLYGGIVLPHDEGRLVRLSSTSDADALTDLSYLSSHPDFALTSPVLISRSPVLLDRPAAASDNAGAAVVDDRFPTVPRSAVARVEAHLAGLRFDPLLSSLVAKLGSDKSVERIKGDVRMLSGEDQSRIKEDERWVSRHSMSEGGYRAANWVTAKMSSYGFTCAQLSYLPNLSPMVECVYDDSALGGDDGDDLSGKPTDIVYGANEMVVLSAHYDSRGSFGYPTAPGADDDASGTTLVLAVARHIYEHRLRFGRKLVLCLFSGEEQGLLSSSWYAKQLRARNEDVAFMLQVDMVGYRKPGEPMQLARPDVIGLEVAGHLVGNYSELYVPELVIGYTPACCSDHQSFVTEAYPATWIFERNGAIADPCYHDSCDKSDRPGYDFAQIAAHTKVAFATVWETAGGALP